MTNRSIFINPKLSYIIILISFSFLLFTEKISAHCDGIDGPVVKAAISALENRDINLVLIWIQEKDEEEVQKAFEETIKVRRLSPEAKVLADKYFFETVVRLHRSGEGEPYTGLKPAGRDLGPAIPLADLSIEKNSLKELNDLLIHSSEQKLQNNFELVTSLKNYNKNNIAAGREFVEAYVQFIHYAEKLYELSNHSDEHNTKSKEIHKH
ncbi:MAG: DUF6448 family protein [Ignavibacteria bacterium]|nr:DUF6448 family protein [Ignavibacteria bacterium]